MSNSSWKPGDRSHGATKNKGTMTPATLNKRIRKGETFWVKDPSSNHKEFEVIKARSVKGKCQVKINSQGYLVPGQHSEFWIERSVVRLASTTEWIPLIAEGRMDWAIN